MSLLELFCHIDDFCQNFEKTWQSELLESGMRRRRRATSLCLSEMLSIVVHFHQSEYRNFKAYYTKHVQSYLRAEFPKLVSYSRFIQLLPSIVVPLCAYLNACYGDCTGISFIDSTALAVCENRRIQQHKVFRGLAQRGHSSTGWYFGFKLHLVVNDCGEILACCITPANVDDRHCTPQLSEELWGKLFGDKGYLSKKLFLELFERGLQLITKLRRNMKNQLMNLSDKLLLRKRAIIETINDQLKNISQIEHSRHRSIAGFMTNVLAGLIAYSHQSKKPSLHFREALALESFIQN
jgi:IS5 family transposase